MAWELLNPWLNHKTRRFNRLGSGHPLGEAISCLNSTITEATEITAQALQATFLQGHYKHHLPKDLVWMDLFRWDFLLLHLLCGPPALPLSAVVIAVVVVAQDLHTAAEIVTVMMIEEKMDTIMNEVEKIGIEIATAAAAMTTGVNQAIEAAVEAIEAAHLAAEVEGPEAAC